MRPPMFVGPWNSHEAAAIPGARSAVFWAMRASARRALRKTSCGARPGSEPNSCRVSITSAGSWSSLATSSTGSCSSRAPGGVPGRPASSRTTGIATSASAPARTVRSLMETAT